MSNERDPSQNQNKKIHVCNDCGSSLVQPTRWEQARDRRNWRLWTRCPECEHTEDAIYGEREIDAYDEALDEGTEMLAGQLKQLETENMKSMADSFAVALQHDLINADDFRIRKAA